VKNSFDTLEPLAPEHARPWQLPQFGEPAAQAPLRTAEQIESIEAAAYEEGFVRGRAEGLKAGAAEIQAQAIRLRTLLEHCARPLAQLDAEVEAALVELALQAARRLVQSEFEIDPLRMAGTVREAIAALAVVPREVRVHLHPEDARLLQDQLTPPPEVSAWRLVPDVSLQRGDCRISGETGWIDATLASRTRSLGQTLMAEAGMAA
jgi:flagellar assembly protein FliH